MVDIINKNKISIEEKIISLLLTISILVITIAGCIASNFFGATTISLRKK